MKEPKIDQNSFAMNTLSQGGLLNTGEIDVFLGPKPVFRPCLRVNSVEGVETLWKGVEYALQTLTKEKPVASVCQLFFRVNQQQV